MFVGVVVGCCYASPRLRRGFQCRFWKFTCVLRLGLPRSPDQTDPKKLEKLEKVETKSQSRLAHSQGLIFLKVVLCRQGIFYFCLKVGKRLGFLKVSPSFVLFFSRSLKVFSRSTGKLKVQDFPSFGSKRVFTPWEIWRSNAISSVTVFSRPCRKNVSFLCVFLVWWCVLTPCNCFPKAVPQKCQFFNV